MCQNAGTTSFSFPHANRFYDFSIKIQHDVRELKNYVIKPDEAEKTQMYCCDWGKESYLPVNLPILREC